MKPTVNINSNLEICGSINPCSPSEKIQTEYPEVTYLGEQFGRILLYREWNLGRFAPPRLPQPTDAPVDFLLEDWSNLGLVLNDLEHRGLRNSLREYLSKFYAPN